MIPHPPLISIENHLSCEAVDPVKHEDLGGQVHAMAGATSGHNQLGMAFLGLLFTQLRGKPCRPFDSDAKVKITFADRVRFYYPDAMVVCRPNPLTDHFQESPSWSSKC